MSKTFDLSTLNLSAGTHEITVKARASGYEDSEPSNAVSYMVAGDTVQVSGTWYFNTLPSFSNTASGSATFTSNGTSFKVITVLPSGKIRYLPVNGDKGDEIIVYDGYWQDKAYRTITFDGVQTVSKEFYDWLVANAVQTHKLLPIGTYVWNERIDTDSYYYINVEFVSNGETFAIVDSDMVDDDRLLYNYGGSSYKTVYTRPGGWVNDAYRTMVFKTNAMIDIGDYDLFMSDVTYIKHPEPV